MTEIAEALGSSWETYELAGRTAVNADIPQEVLDAAFDLPRPAPGAKSVGAIDTSDGAALITVTRVVQGNLSTTADAEVAQFRRIAEGRAARLDFQAVFEAAREKLGVEQSSG